MAAAGFFLLASNLLRMGGGGLPGKLICADPGTRPRVLADPGTRPRVKATCGTRPRVRATAGVKEC